MFAGIVLETAHIPQHQSRKAGGWFAACARLSRHAPPEATKQCNFRIPTVAPAKSLRPWRTPPEEPSNVEIYAIITLTYTISGPLAEFVEKAYPQPLSRNFSMHGKINRLI
ncbi:hypothetical protein [Manganibacter manganicus]|uniref:hypothetical protein n=1 Tax=Manganibacter manganicus TaxID=1873176 RepID=UPI001117CAFB|nr:hypothetical protein [Pseudaminobacter manganicus]